MQRVDGAGILARMFQLGFIARRTYSVPAPLSLVHVDANHKLITFNIVIFGGIDRFSRKILYLDAASNNKSSTAFSFFLDGVHKHGWPSRVHDDQGVENVQIARSMFSVRGTGRGSFISGKSIIKESSVYGATFGQLSLCFTGSWNNHPIRTEANLTPEQLWHFGMLQTPVTEPDSEMVEQLFQEEIADSDTEDDGARDLLSFIRPKT